MDGTMHSNLHLLNKLHFLSKKRRFELFPPFFLMRVKILELADDWTHIHILLPLNWVSANAAGNMFGGYQASLADPIPALACLHMFPDFRIATKKLEYDFVRVGNSDLVLHFDFSPQQAESIRRDLEEHGKATPCFKMHYVRRDGKVCTHIRNTVAIRPQGYVAPFKHIEGEHEH
jgi:acyl-coenzyme A thioesterase PaaI-like protein